MSECPVLFLIYNRPEQTRRVLEAIRLTAPERIYIAGDGPNPDKPGDPEACEATRQLIDGIDWEADVHTRFLETNAGCREAVSSAITWFFEHEEQGIILEDDCIPDPSFFPYCQDLLDRYQDEEKVMTISGFRVAEGREDGGPSYSFNRYHHIWGWATWRRAWEHYREMPAEDAVVRDVDRLTATLGSETAAAYWHRRAKQYCAGRFDTWDYPWVFACFEAGGLSVTPARNLVTNIGFGEKATHTHEAETPLANTPRFSLSFPLVHPDTLEPDPIVEEASRADMVLPPPREESDSSATQSRSWAQRLSSFLRKSR